MLNLIFLPDTDFTDLLQNNRVPPNHKTNAMKSISATSTLNRIDSPYLFYAFL